MFDDETMKLILRGESFGVKIEDLALSMHGASDVLVRFVMGNTSSRQRSRFMQELRRPVSPCELEEARKRVLNALFWELTYWKTPDLYEELTEGEQLHPGIFQSLETDVHGKVVLNVGAGSGRATFECLRHEARLIYAVEPSPGLLRILQQKLADRPEIDVSNPAKGVSTAFRWRITASMWLYRVPRLPPNRSRRRIGVSGTAARDKARRQNRTYLASRRGLRLVDGSRVPLHCVICSPGDACAFPFVAGCIADRASFLRA